LPRRPAPAGRDDALQWFRSTGQSAILWFAGCAVGRTAYGRRLLSLLAIAAVTHRNRRDGVGYMGFGEAVATCFSKYVTFSGRARRPEYWYWVLFGVGVGIVATILDAIVFDT